MGLWRLYSQGSPQLWTTCWRSARLDLWEPKLKAWKSRCALNPLVSASNNFLIIGNQKNSMISITLRTLNPLGFCTSVCHELQSSEIGRNDRTSEYLQSSWGYQELCGREMYVWTIVKPMFVLSLQAIPSLNMKVNLDVHHIRFVDTKMWYSEGYLNENLKWIQTDWLELLPLSLEVI